MIQLVLAFVAQQGIAAQYPGDEGIEKDPRVLFVEDFETGDVKEIGARWGEVSHPENMDLSSDVPANSPGRRSVHISKNGHLYTHTRGVDTLFARFYVKFHEKSGYIHHFVHLIADRTPTSWPKGGAGLKPAGDQGFSSGIEPWGQWGKAAAPGVWHFYSYWHEMKGDANGKYWGNFFEAEKPEPIQPGRWYCIEAMLKANSTPETSDGEQAFWVDGKKAAEFKGIRWRTAAELKVNTFWLLYYITDQAAKHNNDTAADRQYEVWFDDVVLATEYVGPVEGKPKSGKKAATPGRSALLTGALKPTPAPAPEGLAALYPGDEGIEKDPRVLLVEDFETGDLKEIGARWGNIGKPDHLELTDDNHAGSPGKKSLRVQFGHLYTHFEGRDQVFVRYYTKFDPKCGYTHHLPFLVADGEPTPWPKGWAGKRPAGDNFFGTALDAWGEWGTLPPPGKWMLYSYWQEMKADGRGDYWGNNFKVEQQEPIERGRWYCVEMMIKANSTPEAADGEQAFWVDGKKVGEFKGFRWRSTDKLKLNSFWLEHDGETGSTLNKDPDLANRVYNVWFDDVVIATEYIGPVKGSPKNGKKAAAAGRTAVRSGTASPAPPGKVVFSEKFENGPGKFTGGEAREKSLVIPPKGAAIWGAFSTTVRESTTVRFRLKPLADVGQVTVMIWSDKIKDNGRYFITGLKKGEWKTVEFRGVDVRGGWAMDGPSLDGSVMKSFSLLFEGAEDTRILLSDFEVLE